MRRPIAREWRDWLCELKANNPKLSAGRAEVLAAAETENEGSPFSGRKDWPSSRSIARIWNALTAGEREDYLHARWPETFERGSLPWEAAPYVLELIRRCLDGDTTYPPRGARPTIALARWFWRVSLAWPGAPFDLRHGLATMSLSVAGYRAAEGALAWGPLGREALAEASGRHGFPMTAAGGSP